MNLSIVIPAFNEATRIDRTLGTTIEFCKRHAASWEIIVVDDGSRDETASLAERTQGVTCLRNERNRGKGYSVRRGMLAARLEHVLFMDADLSTPIDEALSLHDALEAAGADIAIASRRRSVCKDVRRTPLRRLMAGGFRWCVKVLALRGFHDTQCGFKMFRREIVPLVFGLQRLERWGFDVEILYVARKFGLRVIEVPVEWHESAESRLTAGAPLSMLLDLLKVRWNHLRGRYRRPRAVRADG